MQSILAILVSFSALRSSSADSQITTINEQHSVLKKMQNLPKCIHATIGANSTSRQIQKNFHTF